MTIEELVSSVILNLPTVGGLVVAIAVLREITNRLFAELAKFQDRFSGMENKMTEMNAHLEHLIDYLTENAGKGK